MDKLWTNENVKFNLIYLFCLFVCLFVVFGTSVLLVQEHGTPCL